MTKKILMMLSFILALMLASCARTTGKIDSETTPSVPSPDTSTVTTPTPGSVPSAATPTSSTTPNPDNSIDGLIPDGWHIITDYSNTPQIIKGDLNGDNLEDVVFVIEKNEPETNEYEDQLFRRAMLIAFCNADYSYTQSIITEILDAKSGGAWGDPYDGVSIENGELTLSYYGGSNYRWYSKYVYKYMNDGWYLIRSTDGSYYTGNATIDDADEISYNYLTGEYYEKVTDENGNTTINQGYNEIKELEKMPEFQIK